MKKLGVVIPVYNAERYLDKCIESILCQSYKNIEVMLVDDGSKDGSGKICDKYAKQDYRVRVIHEDNRGPIYARYNGIINLSCDYITFVDADDWIDSETYEKMSVYMDDDIDVIMFQIMRYFDKNNIVYSDVKYRSGKYNFEDIISQIQPNMIWDIKESRFGIDPSLCNKIIKYDKLVVELENAKELNIHYGEDVAVIYPLYMSIKSFAISPEYLYYHRQRDRNKIAEYFSDNEYYDKLYILYKYLKDRMEYNVILLKQIDYFYMYSVGLRMRIYGDHKSCREYIFPFDIIPAKSKIVIYGAAEIGQLYYEQVQRINYCTIVLWVDRNYSSYQHFGVKGIECVEHNNEYDFVVVAIKQKDIAKQVIKDLELMGVEGRKIIWSIR